MPPPEPSAGAIRALVVDASTEGVVRQYLSPLTVCLIADGRDERLTGVKRHRVELVELTDALDDLADG